ncbi:MAG: GIY-YIG nuclease family protein [Candidatus Yanofskybacteria bacterium]|nr:GIY-YIG nuclease family protein [Candidatus Yanofskybacteria bacterium]
MKINPKIVPKTPGVYFFRDKHGQILYIGKAVNLKNRLASYFKSQLGGRTAKLMEKAIRVNWQKTDSEIEALILESQLIKKYRPPFNVMLRDDKQYFFVGFTKDVFPRIFLTHQPFDCRRLKNSKSKFQNSNNLKPDFVGPFTDGNALRITLRLLRRIFPYCTCKQKHNNYCLNYHIGKCLGFCCLKDQNLESRKQNLESYKKNARAIKDILTGKRSSLIKRFKKEMLELGKKHDFEKAIELRDKITKLKKVFENARIILDSKNRSTDKDALKNLAKIIGTKYIPKRIEGYDISNIQGEFATGAMVVFVNGRPDKSQYRRFKIRNSNIKIRNKSKIQNSKSQKVSDFRFHASDFRSVGDTAMLREILTRRFNHPEWPRPDLIIVDGGRAQLNVAAKIIYGHRKTIGLAMTENLIPIVALTKNDKHRGSHIYVGAKKAAVPLKQLPSAVRNLILQVDSETHRFAISYYKKLHRKLGK